MTRATMRPKYSTSSIATSEIGRIVTLVSIVNHYNIIGVIVTPQMFKNSQI